MASQMSTLSVGIVTHNHRQLLEACLLAVTTQSHRPVEVWISDSGSTDGTLDWLAGTHPDLHVIDNRGNVGWAAGQNAAIASSQGDYYLALNPDVVLKPDYLRRLLDAVDADSAIGMAQGKLLQPPSPEQRAAPLIDSAGIVMLRDRRLRHRGYAQADRGQWDTAMQVFAVDGAAPLYRRAMLEEIRIGDDYFDSDFYMYREEIDLSWRAQWLGWKGLYVPQAVGFHERTYTPATRSHLPAITRQRQFRNRLLMMVKNDTLGTFLPALPHILWFELRAAGYLLLSEREVLPAYASFVSLLPTMWRKRKQIMSRRRASSAYIRQWFK